MNRTPLWLANLLQCHEKNKLKKNMILLGSAAILLSLVGSRASAQTEPTVWAHKVSWTSISNHNHTARRDFPLGMGQDTWPGQPSRNGDQSTIDDTTACALAQAAGIDAFALDIFPSAGLSTDQSLLAARLNAAAKLRAESGKTFYVSPCLDTPTQSSPSQLAALIQGLVTNLAQRPEWPKFNGAPIIWTYNATSATSSYWQQVFSLLAAQKIKVLVVLDAGSLFSQASTTLPTAELNAYAALPVALYAFGGDLCQGKGMANCRQYLATNYPNSLAAQVTIGTMRPGYWNESTGEYQDPQGTKLLRDGLTAASSSRWVSITTWDDYSENTQVEPSINMGTGRLDLIHALIAARRGQSWPSRSQFYLSQPTEVHDSGPITGDAIALVAAGKTPATVQVNLCDSAGNILVAGTPTTFTTAGVNAVPYSFLLPQMPASRSAYLSLVCQSADVPQQTYLSEPVKVWPTDNPWRTMTEVMWQAGMQSAQPAVKITNSGATPQSMADQFSGFAGQFFPLLNSNLVAFPDSGSSSFTNDLGVAKSLGLYAWDLFEAIPVSKRWGFFDTKGVNTDGTLRWSTPVWVEPSGGYSPVTSFWAFDQVAGTIAADASFYGNNATLKGGAAWSSPGQTGTSCLLLDGTSGRVTIPNGIFPRGSFTFHMEIKPTLSAGTTSYSQDQYLFCDVAATLILRLRADGRLQAQRMDSKGWEIATGTTVVPANQWSLVTVTYDQQKLRLYYQNHLEAIVSCTGLLTNAATALGCNPSGSGSGYFRGCLDEAKIKAVAVAPPGAGTTVLTPDQQVNLWHFDEATGTKANNATPYGIFLTLATGAGWNKPGQAGAAALSLSGTNSYVTIPNGAFPHSTFTFQAQVKPVLSAGATAYPAGKNQTIFGDVSGTLSVYLRPDGHLIAQRFDGKVWKIATGTTVVPANQWSLVTVTYDQQTLKLYLNGAMQASVACTGSHVNAGTALGYNPWNGGCDYLHGCLDDVMFQPQVVAPFSSNAVVATATPQVSLWHFDEGIGSTASTENFGGTQLDLQGGANWSTPGQTGAACLSLNGTSSRVVIPSNAFPQGAFTFQAQIKPVLSAGKSGYSHYQTIFCSAGGTLVLYLRTDGHLVAQRFDSKGWKIATGTTVVPANQWSRVTVTYDQQTLNLSLNGELQASVACTGTHGDAGTVLGCNSWNGGCDYFQGYLDEVQFQPS